MTRNQKRNLLLTISLIIVFIAVICVYWSIIKFDPFQWIKNNANVFILSAVLGICCGLIIFGFWLTHRSRL